MALPNFVPHLTPLSLPSSTPYHTPCRTRPPTNRPPLNSFNAPEMQLGEGYGTGVDVYALGMVFFTMLTLTMPTWAAGELSVPKAVSASAASLLRQLLAANPRQRATLAELRAQLIVDHDTSSCDLNAWIRTKTAEFVAMPIADNTEGIKNALGEFYSYKSNEKPAKQGKLLEMEGMLRALQSSCPNDDRPVYALKKTWEGLEKAENAYESALRDKYAKFQEVDFKTAKFRAKAGKLSDWAAGAQGRFAGNAHEDPAVGAVEAEAMVDRHKIYESQLDQYKQTLLLLLGIVDDVKEVPEHADSATVAGQADELQATMANLEGPGAAYGEALDAKLAEEQRLADLLKNASKTGELLLFELGNVAEAIDEPVMGNSAQALADQLALLNGDILRSLDAVEDKLKGLEGNVEELAAKEKEKALRAEILDLVDPDANIIDDLRMKHGKRVDILVTQHAEEERKEKLRLAVAEVANRESPEAEKAEIQKAAAAVVLRYFRGMQGRREAGRRRKEQWAVRLVQRSYRGKLGRAQYKLARAERQAAMLVTSTAEADADAETMAFSGAVYAALVGNTVTPVRSAPAAPPAIRSSLAFERAMRALPPYARGESGSFRGKRKR